MIVYSRRFMVGLSSHSLMNVMFSFCTSNTSPPNIFVLDNCKQRPISAVIVPSPHPKSKYDFIFCPSMIFSQPFVSIING